jgi:hypothetical protein
MKLHCESEGYVDARSKMRQYGSTCDTGNKVRQVSASKIYGLSPHMRVMFIGKLSWLGDSARGTVHSFPATDRHGNLVTMTALHEYCASPVISHT